jgi:hypothetical protein
MEKLFSCAEAKPLAIHQTSAAFDATILGIVDTIEGSL